MNDTPKTESGEVETPKVDIIRGRMPLAMVYVIRFREDGTDSELAAKYRTTPGKVNDIKKSANFAYIVKSTRFSQEDIDKAVERAEELGDAGDLVVELLSELEVGSEADQTALDEGRKGSRKPRGKGEAAEEPPVGKEDESGLETEEGDVNLDDLLED